MALKRVSIITLLMALVLAMNANATPSGTWTNLESLFAQANGGDSLSLYTSMKNVITVNDKGSLSKNSVYNLNSYDASGLTFTTSSTLQSVDGRHASTVTNAVTQNYNIPSTSAVSMSQTNTVTGFPTNTASEMTSQMSVLDNTGTSLLTFSSTSDDNTVTMTSVDSIDTDALIDSALESMGFTLDLDDFESLTLGSVQYSTGCTDNNGGITASWGESKNLPVKMYK